MIPHLVGLVVLLVVEILNIYQPVGLRDNGWRQQQKEWARRSAGPVTATASLGAE